MKEERMGNERRREGGRSKGNEERGNTIIERRGGERMETREKGEREGWGEGMMRGGIYMKGNEGIERRNK